MVIVVIATPVVIVVIVAIGIVIVLVIVIVFHTRAQRGPTSLLSVYFYRFIYRTATYITCCAARETFGNHAGHNAQPLDCDRCASH